MSDLDVQEQLEQLRNAQLALRTELHKLKQIVEQNATTSGNKLHSLSNFVMGIEERLTELATYLLSDEIEAPLAKVINEDSSNE